MKFVSTLREEFPSPVVDQEPCLMFKDMIDQLTGKAIMLAMYKTNGNKCRAADLLGINRNTLHHHFEKLPTHERRKVFRYVKQN